jgi:hypothetical protein
MAEASTDSLCSTQISAALCRRTVASRAGLDLSLKSQETLDANRDQKACLCPEKVHIQIDQSIFNGNLSAEPSPTAATGALYP